MPKDAKEIERKVIQILADRLTIEENKIKPESKLVEDLGMDSFGAVEIAFEIKDEFNINIKEDEFKKIKTIKDIISYLRKELNK